jgi:hypothetical protein
VALVLALPFLFQRRRVWWGFFAAASALAAFSILLLGPDGTMSYLRILTVSGSGEGYHINEAAMVNLIGLLARNVAWLPAAWIRWTGWAVYLATIAGLCVAWARSRALDERRLGLAVLAALFTAPHLHYHDAALLLIPVFGLGRMLVRTGHWAPSAAALLPLAVSLFLLFTYNEVLKFIGLGLVMIALGSWLGFPAHMQRLVGRLPVAASG